MAPNGDTQSTPSVGSSSSVDKLTLQILRVQIALTRLKFYSGRIDGAMTLETKDALQRFQSSQNLQVNGLMTTPTLNALGVPVVN